MRPYPELSEQAGAESRQASALLEASGGPVEGVDYDAAFPALAKWFRDVEAWEAEDD